jgi:hypothetical protein
MRTSHGSPATPGFVSGARSGPNSAEASSEGKPQVLASRLRSKRGDLLERAGRTVVLAHDPEKDRRHGPVPVHAGCASEWFGIVQCHSESPSEFFRGQPAEILRGWRFGDRKDKRKVQELPLDDLASWP